MNAAKCATRGCSNPPAAPGGRALTRCADCLTGATRANKLAAQVTAVGALPPLAPVDQGFAFRVPGSPLSWNNALVRPRNGGRPFLSDAAREWKRAVAGYALAARPRDWSRAGTFSVDVQSAFLSASADSDGPLKLIQDALEGVAYDNDRQVVSTRTSKTVNPAAPHVVVTVRREGPPA